MDFFLHFTKLLKDLKPPKMLVQDCECLTNAVGELQRTEGLDENVLFI